MSTKYLFVAALKALQIDSAKLQVETQIMDQSLAVILRQNKFYSIGSRIALERDLANVRSLYSAEEEAVQQKMQAMSQV